jgi:hypothetical protein
VADILEAAALVTRRLASGVRDYRVATSSHCHALASGLRVAGTGSVRDAHLS